MSNAISKDKSNPEDEVVLNLTTEEKNSDDSKPIVDTTSKRDNKKTQKKNKKQKKKGDAAGNTEEESVESQYSTLDKAGTIRRPENAENLPPTFIKREILKIPGTTPNNGINVRVMTYNVLAQCLARRDLFPDNGVGLKWKYRAVGLYDEISEYNPDILFLQEVDGIQYEPFWKEKLFKRLGLDSIYSTFSEKKPHGLVIAYRSSIFELEKQTSIKYDSVQGPFVTNLETKNSGVVLSLKIKSRGDNDAKEFNKTKGIIVATTHLYWHPNGSFQRALQFGQFLKEISHYIEHEYTKWPVIIGGDFNSSPDDLPYGFLMRNFKTPKDLDEKSRYLVERSLNHLFSEHGFCLQYISHDEKKKEEIVESVVTITTKKGPKQVSILKPEYVDECISEMLKLFASSYKNFKGFTYKPISVYGTYYELVDEPNTKAHEVFKEPEFSNWAHAWRGLLDYIFVFQYESTEFKPYDPVIVHELLKMPLGLDMGDHGQPRINEYPSDHLCLMSTLEI